MKHFFLSISAFLLFVGSACSQIDYSEVAFQETNTNRHLYQPNTPLVIKALKNKVRSFPNRLDYRFEYLNELSLQTEWSKFTNETINLIEYSYKSDHAWKWTPGYNAIGEDAEGFLLNTIEDYIFMLYVTGEPNQFDDLRSICEVVLEYKPDHIDFLTYPAMTYDAVGDHQASIAYLQRAEMLHPKSALVTLLIAENYENQGMVNAALAYYRKAAKFGKDAETKEATAHIERLSAR